MPFVDNVERAFASLRPRARDLVNGLGNLWRLRRLSRGRQLDGTRCDLHGV